MGPCALLCIENQVIVVISCTVNRRIQKHSNTAYHSSKLCVENEYVPNHRKCLIPHLKDLIDAFIKRGYQFKILDHHFERVSSVDQEYCQKIRRSHLPKEIFRQYLPSAKQYPTLKALLINIDTFYLSTKIYGKFLKKDYSLPIEEIPNCTS